MIKLRHRITLQQPIETQNTYGEPEIRWQNVSTGVWAEIEPLRGREYFAAKQINAEVEARIKIRYRNDLSAKMKLVHGPICVCMSTATEEYLIDSIIDLEERHRELHLMCTRFAQ